MIRVLEMVREDFDTILKGPNSADIEQKAWAIAHGFEHGEFWSVLETFPKGLGSIKGLPKACKCND